MKLIFILVGILWGMGGWGQQDTLAVYRASTRTERGTPTGEKISNKISKEGGRVFSLDQRLELVIPPGALRSRTNLTITALHNTAPGGRGSAYRLGPEGTTFLKPVQLIYHELPGDKEGSMGGMQGICYQDETGQWYRLTHPMADTLAGTLSGEILHFSDWTLFNYYEISPASARVKVGKKLSLILVFNYPPPSPDPGSSGKGISDEDLLFKPEPVKVPKVWFVNGIRGGNAGVGTLNPVSGNGVTYTAPVSVPDQNPVEVSSEANAEFTMEGVTYHSLKLVAHILVIDNSYEITVIGHNEENVMQCTISTIDSSSCILQLNGKKSRIQDIQNMNFRMHVSGCPCNVRELNPGTSIGPVNIVGAASIDIVPAKPPGKPYAYVTINWIRNMGMLSGMAVDPCMGRPAFSWPGFPVPAVPVPFGFEAKDGEQTIHGGDSKNGFEIKIRKLEVD